MQGALEQAKANHMLAAGMTRSIHSDQDWSSVLEACSEQLLRHIGTTHLLVLLPDPESGGFSVAYQSQRDSSMVAARIDWRALHELDWQMMEQAHHPIALENLEDELKLMTWRPRFLEMGTRSLMAYNVSPGKPPEGIVVVTDTVTRRWNQSDKDALQSVGQQVGLILHQWQLQRQADQQHQLHETMQWGLRNLQRTFKAEKLEQAATHHIGQLLQVPLVALVTWQASEPLAQVADVVTRDNQFAIRTDKDISVSGDAVINWAIQTDGLLPMNIEDLPDITRQWLCGPPNCQILLVALRTAPEHEPSGVIILADHNGRRWSDQQMSMLALLVNQLAWCRRHLQLSEQLCDRKQSLAELNWYKQHQIDDMKRLLGESLQRLNAFSFEQNIATNQRYQQMLRQLQIVLEKINTLSDKERWVLDTASETIPAVTLINRLMDRVNPMIQRQQIWTKVHCDSHLSLVGDITKIEFVLHELMLNACDRSPAGGRIDIWCRQLDRRWLDMSITDQGKVPAALMKELSQEQLVDALSKSELEHPPGLNYKICQTLMTKLGGEFSLETLEDGRTLSRIVIPLGKMLKRAKVQGYPNSDKSQYQIEEPAESTQA
jgi:GAF domain-containing protein